MINIRTIKPKGNTSDKYSINLYKFLKKRGQSKIYFYKKDDFVNKIIEFEENNLSLYNVFIGEFDTNSHWFHGKRLTRVLQGAKLYETYAYCDIDKDLMVDITDWFWNNYERLGRCLWDSSHKMCMMDDKNRFVKINKHSRKCQWCGKIQSREIETTKTIQRKEVWY